MANLIKRVTKALTSDPMQMGSPINPGRMLLASRGVRNSISGALDVLFGPGVPLEPIAPPGTPIRQFDYDIWQNVNVQPRHGEAIKFEQLRELADSYDLLRSVIETAKDEMVTLPWQFRVKRQPGHSQRKQQQLSQEDPKVQELTELFQCPDGEHDFSQWLRMILEDFFVIDATAVQPWFEKGTKNLVGLEPIDGSTIVRKITPEGRTPPAPEVAYQQYIKGTAFSSLSADDILYRAGNPRTWKTYGYGKVEQCVITINISLLRQMFKLGYYTEGNVPDGGILLCPESWTAEQVAVAQKLFDQYMQGQTRRSGGLTFVPGGPGAKVEWSKVEALKDEADEWFARIICHIFGVAPTPFIKAVNRATSDTAREQAEAEGRRPTMQFVQSLINTLVWKYKGPEYRHIEFAWQEDPDTDPKTESEILIGLVNSGIVTRAYAAERLGEDPSDVPEAKMLCITTANGIVPIEGTVDRMQEAADQKQQALDNPQPSNGKPGGDKVSKKKGYALSLV